MKKKTRRKIITNCPWLIFFCFSFCAEWNNVEDHLDWLYFSFGNWNGIEQAGWSCRMFNVYTHTLTCCTHIINEWQNINRNISTLFFHISHNFTWIPIETDTRERTVVGKLEMVKKLFRLFVIRYSEVLCRWTDLSDKIELIYFNKMESLTEWNVPWINKELRRVH